MSLTGRVQKMPLLEKITYLLTPKVRAARSGKEWQIEGKFGGDRFRLNSKQFGSPSAVQATIAKVFGAAEKPLMVNVNYEGGNFAHFNFPGLTQIPSNLALGAAGCPALAREVGRIIGKELRAMGITWNFAPVAELLLSSQSRVLGIRSLGSKPEKVAELTRALIDGMQSEGVAATVKHFPGVLNIGYDFHDRFPLITRPVSEDILLPFRAAVDAGVAMLMPMHGVYSSVDPLRVSTFSKRFVQGLIRDRLGYDGVILSDSITMGSLHSLLEEKGAVELILEAWEAGVDLILLESDISFGSSDPAVMARINQNCMDLFHQVLPPLYRAVAGGRVAESGINESVARVLTVYEQYGLKNPPEAGRDQADHTRTVEELAGRAVTVLRNKDGLLPLSGQGQKITVMLPPRAKSSRADCVLEVPESLTDEIRSFAPEAVEIALQDTSFAQINHHEEILKETDVLIFKTYFANLPQEEFAFQIKAINYLKARFPHLKIAVVSTGTPYELRDLESIDLFVAVYDFRSPSTKAAAEVIFGREEPQGLLPVPIIAKPKKQRVAVVMPTYAGEWLPTTLSFLQREVDSLSPDQYEAKIIVALDGTLGSIDPAARSFLTAQPYLERIEHPGGKRTGKFNLLKDAVKQKRGEVELFVSMDDDLLLAKGSLEAMLTELRTSREQSYLIGAVPLPYASPFSWRSPWGSLMERLYAFNRRDDLGLFPPVSIPWGQLLAFSGDYFPDLGPKPVDRSINDSFLMVSAFFPRIRVCPAAFYYSGVSNSFLEHLARKVRVMRGVESALQTIYAPFAREIDYFYQQEWKIDPEAVKKLGSKDLILLKALQMNNWLVRTLYRKWFKDTKKTSWKIPWGTKTFVNRALFEQLYTAPTPQRQARAVDFAADVSALLRPAAEVEIYMME